ncbi:hypothetical protein EVAR_3377_1 [Eumeta japonica]|uniref:Uncharacterized protein n=1 Tax=Eumeta variegata TaxID=151549 RepID=A0A4C1SUK5_EUMVA|nr:hypothetical protein EVAR_3377_1 [Eumeta japonica]
MLGTRMETGKVGAALSTVDTHKVRVHSRASVGTNVTRRAYRPSPYLYMRIDAARLFGAKTVLNNGKNAERSILWVSIQNQNVNIKTVRSSYSRLLHQVQRDVAYNPSDVISKPAPAQCPVGPPAHTLRAAR